MADKSDDLISAFLDDQLSAEERARFEERLRQDKQLRELTATLKSQSDELNLLPKFALDSNFADRLMQDARIAELSEGSAAVVRPERSNKLAFKRVPWQRSWQYKLGAVVSIAALVLIAAFLTFPQGDEASDVADNTANAAREDAADTSDFFQPVDDGEIESDADRLNREGRMNELPEDRDDSGIGGNLADSEIPSPLVLLEPAREERPEFFGKMDRSKMPKDGPAGRGMAKAENQVPKQIVESLSIRQSDSVDAADQRRQNAVVTGSATATEPRELALAAESDVNEDAFVTNTRSGKLSGNSLTGDVIEVTFRRQDLNFDDFLQSLNRNRIVLIEGVLNEEAKALEAARGGGSGEGNAVVDQLQAASAWQKAFLIEASDQQMEAVFADLKRRAKLRTISRGSNLKKPQSDSLLNSGVADKSAASKILRDDSGEIAKQEKLANAVEVDASSAIEFAKANEKYDDRKQSKIAANKKTVDGKSQTRLRKFLVLLQVDRESETSGESTQAIPTKPSDK